MNIRISNHRLGLITLACGLAALMFLLLPKPASADGILVTAPDRVDGVFSADNKIVYISNADRVLRYDIASQSFLTPYVLGGHLMGMDLSPDGNTLAVADFSHTGSKVWIFIIQLSTNEINQIFFDRLPNVYEGGTFTLAYDKNGQVLISSQYIQPFNNASGKLPLRLYNPSTGFSQTIGFAGSHTMLSPSGDRSVIAYAEPYMYDSWVLPGGRYVVDSHELITNTSFQWSAHEIAANRNGSQFALASWLGAQLYDSSLTNVYTISGAVINGPTPKGVAYNPTSDYLYAAWSWTSEVRVYETIHFQQTDTFDFGSNFQYWGWAFEKGRVRVSQDGKYLLATVDGGVRISRTDAKHTQTELLLSSNPIVAGNSVSVTAHVVREAPASGIPTGKVSFYLHDFNGIPEEINTINLDNTGKAAISITLTAGSHKITAKYRDSLFDHDSSAEAFPLVNKSVTEVRADFYPPHPVYRQNITFTFTVSQTTPGSIPPASGLVYFWEDWPEHWARLDANNHASESVGDWGTGQHCLNVSYEGDAQNLDSIAAPLCFNVEKADSSINIVNNVIRASNSATAVLTASIAAVPPGFGLPTGRANLYLDNIFLTTLVLIPQPYDSYVSIVMSNLTYAVHNVQIDYLGDSNFNPVSTQYQIDLSSKRYLPVIFR